jgi:P27 family predicted phage terminase small subunit
MKHRGRKSTAELTAITALHPSSDDNFRQIVGDPPQPPSHLSEQTKQWWIDIIRDHELKFHQLRTLQAACEAWDRYQQARQYLNEHGLSYEDNKGMRRSYPEVATERDNRIAYIRAMRELGLETSEPPDRNRHSSIGISWRDLEDRNR